MLIPDSHPMASVSDVFNAVFVHGDAVDDVMKMDEKGKIVDHRIAETVIRVGKRMSYPVVKAILEDRDKELMEEYRDYVPMFRMMLELSKKIRAARTARGAIDFDFPEAEVVLNEKGIPVDIVAHEYHGGPYLGK